MQPRELTIEIVVPRKRIPRPRTGSSGRIPRISRLLALAIKCEGLIEQRALRNYTDLALLGRISKGRATQIMNLLNLAPDIQEWLLFLPATATNRDRITERQLRSIVALVGWDEQRELFRAMSCSDDAKAVAESVGKEPTDANECVRAGSPSACTK